MRRQQNKCRSLPIQYSLYFINKRRGPWLSELLQTNCTVLQDVSFRSRVTIGNSYRYWSPRSTPISVCVQCTFLLNPQHKIPRIKRSLITFSVHMSFFTLLQYEYLSNSKTDFLSLFVILYQHTLFTHSFSIFSFSPLYLQLSFYLISVIVLVFLIFFVSSLHSLSKIFFSYIPSSD